MSEGWKRRDLGGAGLQRANLELAARLKRRARAWTLLAAAPLGLHRAYLDDPKGAWAWRGATAVALAAALWDWRVAAAIVAGMVVAAACDAWWIDRRVTALNKRIRRQVFLAGEAPPPGYTGRVLAPPAGRPRSFAEQERALRAAAAGAAPPARDEPSADTPAR
ncbi:MAG: hypothetical protein U1F45_16815 [Burkholderiales bacterium]